MFTLLSFIVVLTETKSPSKVRFGRGEREEGRGGVQTAAGERGRGAGERGGGQPGREGEDSRGERVTVSMLTEVWTGV